MKLAKKEINVFLIMIGVLFLIGCSDKTNQKNDNPEITGSVVEDLKENCRLSDENDCRPIEIRKGEQENEENSSVQETESLAKIPNKTIALAYEINNLTRCEQGWKCVEKNYRAYQFSNCTWTSIERCIYGCKDDACRPAPICKANSFKCSNDVAMKCEEGYEWKLNESCDYKCDDGLCIGKNETLTNSTNSTNAATTNATQANNFILDNCMSVSKYNLTGNNATDEYFTLKNSCSYSIDMSMWTVNDKDINYIFTFSSFNLESYAEVTIVTGKGSNSTTALYWGRGNAVWNNPGDTLYLNAYNGTNVLTKVLTP